jgi:hypothetical protein
MCNWLLLAAIAAIVIALPLGAARGADIGSESSYRYTIISAEGNRSAESFTLSQRDFPHLKMGAWAVTRRLLHGGRQEGVDLVTIDNGKLRITLIPTRGMSLLDVWSGDFRLGWESPVKEVVHPQFVNLESRGGLGWLEGFNELLVRCGLEFAGGPGRDEFIDNTGAKAEMNLTLHGKIGNVPASEVEVIIDRAPPHRIRVIGVVHERSFYGPKLELRTEVSTVPGADEFRIDDAVTNHGGAPQEFMLIYHTNFGVPLLDQGSRVVAAADRVAPINDHAAKSIDGYTTYSGPTPGFIEQVYLLWPRGDAQGRTGVLLKNAAGDRGVSLHWSTRELPYLTLWKNTAALADGYVTGLEPGTDFPYNRKVERQAGRLPRLAPGETRHFGLEFGVQSGTAAVADAVRGITALAAGRAVQVETKPPPAP